MCAANNTKPPDGVDVTDVTVDVLVVGLGAMGSAALYQLSKQNISALGIDRFSPPHAHGSTHGDTRLTRQAIGEGEAYTPLALRSYEIWGEIEEALGATGSLLTITGGLILATPGPSPALHGNADFMGNTLRSAQRYSIAHEILTTEEINARYGQFKLFGGETAYFEQKAGFLRPERCVEAQLHLARQNGARVHVGEKMVGYGKEAGGVWVRTDKGVYHAQKLILTMGPWASGFVPAAYQSLLRVYRQVLFWFDVASHYEDYTPDRFPVFIWDFSTGKSIYGFPALNGPHGGLKVAHEEYGEVTADPSHVNREVSANETDLMYEQFVAPRLRGVHRACVKSTTCLYTVTPDSDFVLDFHPDNANVILASPCSGHGFKHSAAIGEVLAQMATTGKSTIDIASFGLKRFGRILPKRGEW